MTVGRNEPCPCGSGLRYKACHGRPVLQERKVDFVVGGTQKGGTTALAEYLQHHLDICMPRVKEVHFFDTDQHFATPQPDYTRYHAQFEPGATHRALGDATPIYMYWHDAPERIARYNPAMKWIILLRDPAKRAFSQWNMEVSRGNDTLGFDEALAAEAQRCASSAPRQSRNWSYVDRGYYSRQLNRIWQHFPREQTLVLRSDALRSESDATLASVAAFLGVSAFPAGVAREVFALPYSQPMSDEARAFLARAYAEEIPALQAMLGWDLSGWRQG